MKYGPLVLAIVCLLLGWGLASRCHSAPPIDQSKPLQAKIDSMGAKHSADSAAFADSIAISRVRAARFDSAARYQRQQASRLRHIADSLAAMPIVAGDTMAVVPKAAYDSLSIAFDSLEASDSSIKQALREHVLGEGQRDIRLMVVEGELSQTRDLYKDLTGLYRAELKKRRGKCHIGGAVGYGAVLSGGTVHAGPAITMGVACSL